MISIIIPVYNQAGHLNNCLASINNQSYKNYEIIIINDGSTDELDSVIYKYKKIFGYKLICADQPNAGAAAARNKGAGLAKGEYLIFCDADITMRPEMLEAMLKALNDYPEAAFCYSSFFWGKKKFKLWPYDAEKLNQLPYINIASLIRRKYFPGFDETLKRFQDWDLWLTIAGRGHGGIWLNKTLYKINTGGSQTMSDWLPSLSYKILPFLSAVKKYNAAKEIIRKKHNLA
ncbi:MAG: glycosyltransferase family A protein [bacterium]|nr:glycosyltransferase family A protein [bacterium]